MNKSVDEWLQSSPIGRVWNRDSFERPVLVSIMPQHQVSIFYWNGLFWYWCCPPPCRLLIDFWVKTWRGPKGPLSSHHNMEIQLCPSPFEPVSAYATNSSWPLVKMPSGNLKAEFTDKNLQLWNHLNCRRCLLMYSQPVCLGLDFSRYSGALDKYVGKLSRASKELWQYNMLRGRIFNLILGSTTS